MHYKGQKALDIFDDLFTQTQNVLEHLVLVDAHDKDNVNVVIHHYNDGNHSTIVLNVPASKAMDLSLALSQ